MLDMKRALRFTRQLIQAIMRPTSKGTSKFIMQIKRSTLLTLAVAITGLLIITFLTLLKRSPENFPQAERAWNIRSLNISKGAYNPQILLYGSIEAQHQSKLDARTAAEVQTVHVSEGDWTKANQLLITLDDADVRWQLQQRKAALAELEAQIKSFELQYQNNQKTLQTSEELFLLKKKRLERQQYLLKTQVGTEQNLDDAQQDLKAQELSVLNQRYAVENYAYTMAQLVAKRKQLKAQLGSTEKDYQDTRIRSPFNGRITKLLVSKGDRVQMGEPIVELFDVDSIEIRALLPLPYLGLLQKDARHIQATAFINHQSLPAQLERISGELKRGRGGVDLFFKLTNLQSIVTIGQTVSLVLSLPKIDDSFIVPDTAIHHKDKVYQIIDDRLHVVTVTIVGPVENIDKSQAWVVKSSQLKSGDLILASNLPNARTGLKIMVNN